MSGESTAPKSYGYVVGRRPSEQDHPDKKEEKKDE